jgi:transcriptional regulator with XRE-family HTH domain
VSAIKRLMTERKVTHGDLASGAQMKSQSLTKILKGDVSPGADTLKRLADALKVDIVEMFCTEEQARILREHAADAAALRREVADLRKGVDEQIADLKKLVEERIVAPPSAGIVKEADQEKGASTKLPRAGAKDTRPKTSRPRQGPASR